jgi:hypothetical protein
MLRGQLHGLRSPKNQFLVGWRWGVPLEALLAPLSSAINYLAQNGHLVPRDNSVRPFGEWNQLILFCVFP